MSTKLPKILALALLAVPIAGCSTGTPEEVIESRKAAQKAFDDALQAVSSKDFVAAKTLLDQAIDSGKLYHDAISPAHINRAICSAMAGDFESAHADLDKMERGAPNLDEIFAARSFVFQKQGKTREAKAAWAKARRVNRYVRKFGG